jgi:CRP/FNR family transcriptional regulator, anaerobic regulatory protein
METEVSGTIGYARGEAPAAPGIGHRSDNFAPIKARCLSCALCELCPPWCGLTRSEIGVASRLVFSRSRVRRGESLYRVGDRFTSLYAVRNGFFKSTVQLEDGRRDQVTGFSMTGDVLGMDGIATQWHTCNTTALADSDVCAIPFAGLQELAHRIPGLQRQLHKTMSREIVREHGVMVLLGSLNADERVAMFLLNLSQRFATRGSSPCEFTLRMTRGDIGGYLGLTTETVSRTLCKFQQEGLIAVCRKFICILDSAGLKRVMVRESR